MGEGRRGAGVVDRIDRNWREVRHGSFPSHGLQTARFRRGCLALPGYRLVRFEKNGALVQHGTNRKPEIEGKTLGKRPLSPFLFPPQKNQSKQMLDYSSPLPSLTFNADYKSENQHYQNK
ncbi:hypothetical protein CEXT_626801 [Caerostris extrusa]|uniref:Uncharacterized protein n=1 Tax=Caerostris extrusa TaxID=172846 RepID=A0AAV4WTU7_CAEEX|nr:hypothetical protein CEXT_626801 [Caerostris extrusa]